MPHLRIEHSANISERCDLQMVADRLREVMEGISIFPADGIRVRCLSSGPYSVVGGDPRNGFVHLELRIGFGRSLEARQQAGERLFAAAREIFADQLAEGFLALTLEIVEIAEHTSWKANGIRARLDREETLRNES